MNLNENRGRELYGSKSGDFAFRFTFMNIYHIAQE